MLLAGEVGKGQTGCVLDDTHLGGIGGQLFAGPACTSFGGAAHRDPMCTDGVSSGPSFGIAWHGPSAASGPPIIADGAVWSVDTGGGGLYALDPTTGATLAHLTTLGVEHFATPAAGGGRILVGGASHVQAFTASVRPPAQIPPGQGYWLAAADSHGGAQLHGSMGGMRLNAPVVGVAATPTRGGYWLLGPTAVSSPSVTPPSTARRERCASTRRRCP